MSSCLSVAHLFKNTTGPPFKDMEEEKYNWGTTSNADVAQSLTSSAQLLEPSKLSNEFNQALSTSLQELSLRITQLSGGKAVAGVDLQERRQLAQKARHSIQEALARLKEDQSEMGLQLAVKGCLVALRAAEHVAAQQVVAAAQPVFQTLSILEKTTTMERLVLNIKLLGMRLTKFLDLGARLVHDLRGSQRRTRVQVHVYAIQRLLTPLVGAVESAIQRPMNAHDRASRHLFFSIVKQNTESVTKLFTAAIDEEQSTVGRFVKSVDLVLDKIDTINTIDDFELVQNETEWLIGFAMSVAKAFAESHDEKDIVNGCHHLVNELGNLKEAIINDEKDNLSLAKEVAKDFTEVTEQSVNSALLRLIVLCLSQLHVPLDRLIHSILTSDKLLPDRLQQDLSQNIESTDDHSDRLFHIAHFALYCTSDAATAQTLVNSLHLAQILEKELVPASLKLYFSPDDIGARSQLRTLRQLWRTELETIETCILDIVDPTAFCVIVEAEARRIASAVKKDQYSQDRDWLRLSVSQVVRLCQMAVDFAWKEMSSSSETDTPNQLPDDHPIIRVERSTWEVQAALKMVIANVEDLHVHKVMIRRVQLMVTCTTAMVECLVDANRTEKGLASQTGVKVLTSVSRINISFRTEEEEADKGKPRVLSKSFKNITMNNTIGVSGKMNILRNLEVVSIHEGLTNKTLEGMVPFHSRKMASEEAPAMDELYVAASTVEVKEDQKDKEIFRKIKLHSDSDGFRSPLKQISNQLGNQQRKHRNN